MSHKTILTVDGESRHLLTYHHNYFRQKQKMKSFDMQSFFNTPIACDLRNAYHSDDFEHFSEPPQHILGGMFYVSFESTDNDELFYHWMKGSEVLNGSIEFYNTLDEDDIPFQRIEFWDAFLVRIKEQTTQGAYPMIMECDISAAIVRHNRNDATLHRKSWYFSDIDKKPISANNEVEEEEPEIVEVFWKDADGNKRIDEMPIDYVVSLCAKTTGFMEGDEVTITLTSPRGEKIKVKALVDSEDYAEVNNFDLSKYI